MIDSGKYFNAPVWAKSFRKANGARKTISKVAPTLTPGAAVT